MNEPRTFQNAAPPAASGYRAGSPVVTAPVSAELDPLDMRRSEQGFNYVGIDSLGVTIKGFVQTTDLDLAEKELERAGIRVVSIAPKASLRTKNKKPTMIEFASLAEQFGDLMDIGEPPTQVCRLLSFSQTNKYLADALTNAGELVLNGWTLSEAFAAQRDKNGEPLFPITFICALRIGEEVGTATDYETGQSTSAFQLTLRRFAEAQKKAEAIRSSIRSALMYPIAVFGFCFIAMGIVLYFVMPRMVDLYTSLLSGKDQTLPFLTRVMIGASDFMLSWWGLAGLVAFIIAAVWFTTWVKSGEGMDKLKVWSLRWPIFGSFFRHYYAAQTLRTLAMLSSGIPSMSERFTIAAETSTNPEYAEMLLHIRNRFMVDSTDLSKLFMPFPFLMGKEFNGVLMTFEKTADMQGTFHNYARVVETRAERELERVLFVFQNFAIVPVGLFVALVLIALYSPMFNLAEKLGGG
ncbi:MAG: type II secretion system F family protein [bacterium]|nr:type II secretion system F family protein [bacterium]